MKRVIPSFVFLLCFFATLSWAQLSNPSVLSGVGAPTGSCNANQLYVNTSNGNIYAGTVSGGVCTWTLSGGGGSTYTLPTATSSTLGGVKPDGTSILNTAGVISATYTSVGADASGAAAARQANLSLVAGT